MSTMLTTAYMSGYIHSYGDRDACRAQLPDGTQHDCATYAGAQRFITRFLSRRQPRFPPSYEYMRSAVFAPYQEGEGPIFKLRLFDTHRRNGMGKDLIAYTLQMDGRVVFRGADFGSSPRHAIDSDETVAGIMGFLTLRPGDTDSEYFASYSDEQLDFCSEHAEALSAYMLEWIDDRKQQDTEG